MKVIWAIATLIFLNSSLVHSETKLNVVTESWPPYNFRDINGNITGIATEKVKQVLEHADIPYKIKLLPWARAYHIALHEPYTLIFTIYRTHKREKLFQWICPLFNTPALSFFALASRTDIVINQLPDSMNYTIGITRGEYSEELLRGLGFYENGRVDVSANDDINLKQLLSGRIDLLIDSDSAIKERLKKLELNASFLKPIYPIVKSGDAQTCMALSLATPKEIAQRIRMSLNVMNK
mgnify:CR=1 FL=1